MEIAYALILRQGDVSVSKEYDHVPTEQDIADLTEILIEQLEGRL